MKLNDIYFRIPFTGYWVCKYNGLFRLCTKEFNASKWNDLTGYYSWKII